MHVDVMSSEILEFLKDTGIGARLKNTDYHPDKVAMIEFMQTAFDSGITVEQDIWGRVAKQMAALRRFVIEGHVESESPKSRMGDVCVYMSILNFWVEFKTQCLEDAANFVTDKRPCEGSVLPVGQLVVLSCIAQMKPKHEQCRRCQFLTWLEERIHEIDDTRLKTADVSPSR